MLTFRQEKEIGKHGRRNTQHGNPSVFDITSNRPSLERQVQSRRSWNDEAA